LIRGFVFIFILLVFACFALPQTKAISSDDQAARDAALRWLSLLDTGHYRQAFDEWPPRLKAASAGRDYFVKWMETRRVPLGRARGRLLYNVSRYHTAIGWPDGDYQRIYFKTSFEHKAAAWERVILTKETGHWQFGNYSLR
jgi:uncharacterized protein DUF4019